MSILERLTFSSNLTNKYNPQELINPYFSALGSSNLTNKYNPQELLVCGILISSRSNLTNKYNPQEHTVPPLSPP